MADPSAIARQIGAVALAQKVLQRLGLGVRLGINGVPADHAAVSSASATGAREIRSMLGAATRPGGNPAISAALSRSSKLACGAPVSVTMMPSSRRGRAYVPPPPRPPPTPRPPHPPP